MRLYTVQPLEVVEEIKRNGYFVCSKEKSINYKDFYNAYNWISQEMLNRKILPFKENTLPVWAWYLYDGVNKLDLRRAGLGETGEKCCCLTLEVPDNMALLSDYNAWHFVLNNSWLDKSRNEKEFEQLHDWYDGLDVPTRERLKLDSWQRVFDVSPYKDDWTSRGYYVQATFWVITRDMIVEERIFKVR